MYKIEINPTAQNRIEWFILRYRDAFLDLYDDTGLWDAEIIIKEQYIKWADILRISLHNAIKSCLSPNKILGYSHNPTNNIYQITTSLGSRRLFLSYKEIQESQTRIITDIEILRK